MHLTISRYTIKRSHSTKCESTANQRNSKELLQTSTVLELSFISVKTCSGLLQYVFNWSSRLLKEELKDLLEREAKNDLLKSIPLYSSKSTGTEQQLILVMLSRIQIILYCIINVDYAWIMYGKARLLTFYQSMLILEK